jgi:Uma2 family endonuclease
MSEAAQVETLMSVAQFIAFADARPLQRFELLAGVPVAMVSGTLRHALIAGRIDRRLGDQVGARGCMSLRDFGVAKSEDSDYLPQPDVMVRCGPVDDRRRWIADPIVVIEVLSPSTMADDRGYELKTYMTFESLRHLVLVYQDEIRLEHWFRSEDGAWNEDHQVLKAPNDRLDLAAVGASLLLSDIYADVSFG